jgi:hypothetical protein
MTILEHPAGHISLRFARLLGQPGTRIVEQQAWNVAGVRMWVDGVQSSSGGIVPLLTVQRLTLDAEDARRFVHAACEVRAAMLTAGAGRHA